MSQKRGGGGGRKNEDSSNSDWLTQGCVIPAMEAKHLFDLSHRYELSQQMEVK